MDSRLIDVTLGLALTFAMASLLATALMEGISSYFNHRGETLRKLIESVFGDDGALIEKFFKNPLVASMYKDDRLPSYLSSDTFTTTLLNVVSEGTPVTPRSGTPADFLAAIKAGPLGEQPNAQTLLYTLGVLLQGVESDWPRFELEIRGWFERAGERASGWYKRGTSMWLFLIGAVMAAAFNIDAVRIATVLWNDPILREKAVVQAQAAVDDWERKRAATPAPAPREPTETGRALCNDDDPVCNVASSFKELQSTGLPVGWGGTFPTPHFAGSAGGSFWMSLLDFFVMVVGWLVTAVAITLGAPFWFDTLSRLARLRGSGAKSDDDAQKWVQQPPPGVSGGAGGGGQTAAR